MIIIAKRLKSEDRPTVQINGSFSIEQFIWLFHNNELDSFIKNRSKPNVRGYCPPTELIDKIDSKCFYCESCFKECEKLITKNKNTYKINKEKYNKSDFEIDKKDVFGDGFFIKQNVISTKKIKR